MKSPENNAPGQPIGPAPEKQLTPKHNIDGAIDDKWDKVEKIKKLEIKKREAQNLAQAWKFKQADLLKYVAAYKFSIANRETDVMSADLSSEARETAANIVAMDKAFLSEYEKKFAAADSNLKTHETEIENLTKEINQEQRSLNRTERTLDSQIPDSMEEAMNNYRSVDYKPNED